MPSITSGRVLVTGANGYVAAWVLKDLLDRSFTVRGTVRSATKGAYLKEFFKAHGDKLELVVVEDMTQDGAFDAAVEGVDAILHVAAPVNLNASDPDDLIVPGVKGTVNVLKSAAKHRATVKRIVITSSCAAVVTPPLPGAPPRVFDENDWNDVAVREVREKGPSASPLDMYRASKVLAERAAWEFYEKEKLERTEAETPGWDLVVLVPPFIFGPLINEAPTLELFGGTARQWYDRVVKSVSGGDGWMKNGYEYVDVRDFAHSEVLALITPDARGERIIIRGGSYTWQQIINIAHRSSNKIPGEDSSYDLTQAVYPVRYSAEKGRRILGIEYRSLEDSVKDMVEDFDARGWL
ncbi:NAD-P-binding protein [Trametes gibbosa]|nr:NAD-P-binding protein [Trametes gibbosa]